MTLLFPHLVNLRVSGEERSPSDHLGEDTAEAPVVHAARVELGAQQDLRGSGRGGGV